MLNHHHHQEEEQEGERERERGGGLCCGVVVCFCTHLGLAMMDHKELIVAHASRLDELLQPSARLQDVLVRQDKGTLPKAEHRRGQALAYEEK